MRGEKEGEVTIFYGELRELSGDHSDLVEEVMYIDMRKKSIPGRETSK